MPPRLPSSTLLPFLYPSFSFPRTTRPLLYKYLSAQPPAPGTTGLSSTTSPETQEDSLPAAPPPQHDQDAIPISRLNPSPDDFSAPTFTDKALLTLHAGRGGHGCISFHREAYRPDGPPDGGDGGSGGSIYVQAVHGETSLHKLARRRVMRAGRGTNGKGGGKPGSRGEDIVLLVPVGTIVRELERTDPVFEEEEKRKALQEIRWRKKKAQKQREREMEMEAQAQALRDEGTEKDRDDHDDAYSAKKPTTAVVDDDDVEDIDRDKFLIYPGISKTEARSTVLPRVPHLPRPNHQPPAPIMLDLSKPTPHPILLASGGAGGLGNPHFITRSNTRPVFATRGTEAVSMSIEMELKLLADVGLVGLPNAGKSTLLRGLSNSRARVGSWAFTTLRPNIGTVVLDQYQGRPAVTSFARKPASEEDVTWGIISDEVLERRSRFTVADIPGLIEGAHLNKGLGIEFLRHVERAGVLAFVLDLSAGDAVKAVDALWTEVGMYAQMREDEEQDREKEEPIDWSFGAGIGDTGPSYPWAPKPKSTEGVGYSIAAKPWFVIANKADLPGTEKNYVKLKTYLEDITAGEHPHPSGLGGGWTKRCEVVPISAIYAQGVDRVISWMVELLDG